MVTDVNAKKEDGSYMFDGPPCLEIQHASTVFKRIPSTIELRGAKRFVEGDPLITFLGCMRKGRKILQLIWEVFENAFATDSFPGK